MVPGVLNIPPSVWQALPDHGRTATGVIALRINRPTVTGEPTVFGGPPPDPVTTERLRYRMEDWRVSLDRQRGSTSNAVYVRGHERLSIQDAAFDVAAKSSSWSALSYRHPSLIIDSGAFDRSDGKATLKTTNLHFRAGAIDLFSIGVNSLEIDPDGRSLAEDIRLRVLGISALYVPEISYPGSSSNQIAPEVLAAELLRRVGAEISPDAPGRIEVARHPQGSNFAFGFGFGIKAGDYPSYDLRLVYRLAGERMGNAAVLNPDAMSNDYSGDFFTNIRARTPRGLFEDTRSNQFTIGYRGILNHSQSVEGEEDLLTMPYSVALEKRGPIGQMGYRLQARYERVESKVEGTTDRPVLAGMLGLFGTEVTPGVNLSSRIDGISRGWGGDAYTWVRPMIGGSALLVPQVRMSAGYYYTVPTGEPRFHNDFVERGSAIGLRTDFMLGPTTIRTQTRTQLRGSSHWSSQIYLEQVVGVLRVWAKYDFDTRGVAMGFSFRVKELTERLRGRSVVLVRPDHISKPASDTAETGRTEP